MKIIHSLLNTTREWVGKTYNNAEVAKDLCIAFSEVFFGEFIRSFLSNHPKARLIIDYHKSHGETSIIPHTILKRIIDFNQLDHVYRLCHFNSRCNYYSGVCGTEKN